MTADSQETQAQRQDEDSRQESQSNGKDGGGGSITQELKDAVREAALEVLRPAARQATSAAAKFAVKKGPELVTEKAMPSLANAGGLGGLAQQAISKGGEALSQSGGVGGIAGKLMSKVGGGGGGGEASGWGRNRRMPVQQVIHVSVPVRDVYHG